VGLLDQLQRLSETVYWSSSSPYGNCLWLPDVLTALEREPVFNPLELSGRVLIEEYLSE
jgi:hypothetical protein